MPSAQKRTFERCLSQSCLKVNTMSEPTERPPLTKLTLVLWALPILAGVLVTVLAFVMNWEPWFGYASIIAGGLLTVMLAGNHFNVGPNE